jgi:hypothetical protein
MTLQSNEVYEMYVCQSSAREEAEVMTKYIVLYVDDVVLYMALT